MVVDRWGECKPAHGPCRGGRRSVAVMTNLDVAASLTPDRDRDEVFLELTRSICPVCKTTIDAEVNVRDNQVFLRKRCPEHGEFEARVYGDAQMYVDIQRFNKPGTRPLQTQTEVKDGCPSDCGLCPEHKQHACLGIIEVNTGCNLDCPICFADSGTPRDKGPDGYSITLEQCATMLDVFVAAEGEPEVVMFSGGEPTIHKDILAMIDLAQAAPDRRGQPQHQRHPAGLRQAVRGRARPTQPARAPSQHLPAVRRPRSRHPHRNPRTRPARDQAAGTGQLRRCRAHRHPGRGHREGPQRARDRAHHPVRAGPRRGTVRGIPTGHPLGAPRRVRPAHPADQLRRPARHRRTAAAVVHHRRLLPGPLLRPLLSVDHLPDHPGPSRRRGLRAGADPAAAAGRGLPRLRLQPGRARLRHPRGPGEAVERLGVRRHRDQQRPAHHPVSRGRRSAGLRGRLRGQPPRGAGRDHRERLHDRGPGLPGPVHAQRPPADEVLRGGDHPRRAPDPVLRLQLRRLPRTGPREDERRRCGADVVPNARPLRPVLLDGPHGSKRARS